MSARLALAAAAVLVAPAWAGSERISDARLATRVAADPAAIVAGAGAAGAEWLAWTVPGVPAATDLCCFGRDWKVRRCSLAGRDSGWGTRDEGGRPTAPTELLVLIEVERGRIRALRLAGPTCPVDGARRALTWLDGVRPEASLAVLDRVARAPAGRRGDDSADAAIAAIAHHASPDADRRLAALAADARLDTEAREQALFWAGQVRGRAGYDLLDRVLAGESDPELRQKALFALSESSEPEARPRLMRAAREDRSSAVRGEALFWLVQSAGDRVETAAFILDAIRADRDPEVREQGIFALSQLDGGVEPLIRLLRESDDPDLQRQALFWLGQSEDPRALEELSRLLAE